MAAPHDMEQRVLHALIAPPATATIPERPLISRTTWATIIIFVMGISVGVLIAPGSGTNAGKLTGWLLEKLSWGDVFSAAHLPWILGVMAAAACLLGIDTYLSGRKAALQARRG